MIEIENEFLRVRVKSLGAELCSLQNKKTGVEHIWQAEPSIWAKHAPLLFPIIGELKNGKYLFEGMEFKMSRHGFLREMETKLCEQTENKLVFELNSNVRTLEIYPFHFNMKIGYELAGHTLTNFFEVKNTGFANMYFNLGAHPAFAIPFYPNEQIDDYYIDFDNTNLLERHLLTNAGLFSGKTQQISISDGKLAISENLFNQDALVFKNLKTSSVRLRSRNHAEHIKIDFPEFPYLGIWAKPGANFVCLEPWIGCADSLLSTRELTEKEQIIEVSSQQSFKTAFAISIAS